MPVSERRVRMISDLTGCLCPVIIPEDLPIMFNLHSSHTSQHVVDVSVFMSHVFL